MADDVPYLEKDWRKWLDDQRHPYIAQAPTAAAAALAASYAGQNQWAAAAAAAGYFAFTAQNAFGYKTLDIVHSLAGGDVGKFRLYNAIAGGAATAGALHAAGQLGITARPSQSAVAMLPLFIAAVGGAQYASQAIGDSAAINN